MIQANEIRVGCTFLHKKEWSYRQDKKYLKSFYFNWTESDWYALGECTLSLEIVEPIPLDEDILLKCGFELDVKGCYFEYPSYVCLFQNINCNVIGLSSADFYYSTGRGALHVKSLHQLNKNLK